MKLGRSLYTIAVLPIVVVVAIPVLAFFAVVSEWHLPQWIWSNRKWKTLLYHQGRFRNPGVTVTDLRNGTLIVDSPTLGWGLLQCWWTPDELKAITPHTIPTEDDRQVHIKAEPDRLEMPFDCWVHSKYLHPETGTAILLSSRRGDRWAARCTRLNPNLETVKTWSGPVGWPVNAKRSV